MADIKTNLRELSVATTIGLLKNGISFNLQDLYDATTFLAYAAQVIDASISNVKNICIPPFFSEDLKQIIKNGYKLGRAIFENNHFSISKSDRIAWLGNDTQKEDPVDIVVGNYKFSLKEESFILENMGLYKLLNCYTGSNYKRRHIFSDYARSEYEEWFLATWLELLEFLLENNNVWSYNNPRNGKRGKITLTGNSVKLEYTRGRENSYSHLPRHCTLSIFENNTCSKTREEVFSKFINQKLDGNPSYNAAKRKCAVAASEALAAELNANLNYNFGLPRFLRIHNFEYYYAKTTSAGTQIYKVPDLESFGNDITIESIVSSVPDKQANILTTIKNRKTGKKLVLRNECRFSHGQFNGTPEAKMYYEQGGSLLVIYEPV